MSTMMGLGPFRFSLSTAAYQSLERSDEFRWVAQERIGREPAAQFIGPGQTTFALSGTIYPHFRGGWGQVEAMRAIAKTGAPQMLVSGLGRIFGLFYIENVSETQTIFWDNGAPRKQEFNLDLKSYGADGGIF
ncbi:phage tail protein [Mesorhizobium sp. CA14]|uniref:phage tail protein n=1 Tax=Mesorhizobium sp. CA14 TaxID=2876642 RepID=UPI001CCEC76C|nr:phage tail protein [Mesorhizobium sp. CA14]MBZ9850130.1 phage tail protein [Mesorhizobium sp. CA14]